MNAQGNGAMESWVQDLTSAFVQIATGLEPKREYSGEQNRAMVIAKWQLEAPITYLVVGQVDVTHRAAIQNHLAKLSMLTGLNFTDVSDSPIQSQSAVSAPTNTRTPAEILHDFRFPDPAWHYAEQIKNNGTGAIEKHLIRYSHGGQVIWWRASLLIIVSDRRTLSKMGRSLRVSINELLAFMDEDIKCFAKYNAAASGPDAFLIRSAAVFIPHDVPSFFQRCVSEELAQSMGLPNDIQDSPITRFNDTFDGPPELTVFDEMFLRILYHPSIRPGQGGEELRNTVLPLIEDELRRTPTLQSGARNQ
jgi:hypothetical protein